MQENNRQNEITNAFYLNEDRRNNVKQSFKAVTELFEQDLKSETTICDIGCATGDYLWYLKSSLSIDAAKLCGGDINEEFLQIGGERMSDVTFVRYDLRTPWTGQQYDIVTCFGTLYLFEDTESVLENLLDIVKESGRLYVFGHFNNYGYKVKYEYSKLVDGKRTVFCDYAHSIEEIGLYLKNRNLEYSFYPFEMKVFIHQRAEQPLRVWTERLADDRLLQIDGLDRIKNQFILEIKK